MGPAGRIMLRSVVFSLDSSEMVPTFALPSLVILKVQTQVLLDGAGPQSWKMPRSFSTVGESQWG